MTRRPAWQDEDLDAFRELARSFCEKELVPHRDRWLEQHHVDRELWRRAGSVGLLCLSVPEEYGGGGGTFAHEVVLIEVLNISQVGPRLRLAPDADPSDELLDVAYVTTEHREALLEWLDALIHDDLDESVVGPPPVATVQMALASSFCP